MKFGLGRFVTWLRASEARFSSGVQIEKAANGGARIELTGVPCGVWTDGENELERQGAVFEIQDILAEGLRPNPGTRDGQPDIDAEKKVVVWRGQGTVEHVSKSDRKDADEAKKIVVTRFPHFPPKAHRP
jgi:hypothetical protein